MYATFLGYKIYWNFFTLSLLLLKLASYLTIIHSYIHHIFRIGNRRCYKTEFCYTCNFWYCFFNFFPFYYYSSFYGFFWMWPNSTSFISIWLCIMLQVVVTCKLMILRLQGLFYLCSFSTTCLSTLIRWVRIYWLMLVLSTSGLTDISYYEFSQLDRDLNINQNHWPMGNF